MSKDPKRGWTSGDCNPLADLIATREKIQNYTYPPEDEHVKALEARFNACLSGMSDEERANFLSNLMDGDEE